MEHLCCIQDTDAYTWLMAAMESLSNEEFIKVAITLWSIWYVRSKAIDENAYQSPLSTHLFIERYITDLNIVALEKLAKNGEKGTDTKSSRWIPPSAGLMKINVDAAISKNMNKASAGMFMGASALIIEGCVDPEIMEAVACHEGLALASDLMLQRFKLALDCALVVRNIRDGARGPYGQIVKEIKDRASVFELCSVVHEG